MDTDLFCRDLPKVELHAHLNGSLSRATMLQLRRYFADRGIVDKTNVFFDEFQIGAGDNRSLSDCFQVFGIAHTLTSMPETLEIATILTLEEFQHDGCCYIELRSTPRQTEYMSRKQYLETIIKAIQKKLRCTHMQKDKIVDFMVKNKDLALGTFTCPMGSQVHQAKWEILASCLAELVPQGALSSGKRDLKSRAKAHNAQVNRAMTATGNMVGVPLLSVQDEKILSLIGRTTSEGIVAVPESPIGLVPASPPLPQEILTSPPPRPPSRHSPKQSPRTVSPTFLVQPGTSSGPPHRPRSSTAANLGEIYSSCSESMTSALSDISNHLKRRNEIETERNDILREKNQIMLLKASIQLTITSKLIVSINRASPLAEAEDITNLAIEFYKLYPDVIVGIEMSGNPMIGKFESFVPLFVRARNAGLKITLHCGEVNNPHEVLDMLKFKPDRIGHGVCIHPRRGGTDRTWSLLCETKIPVEVCLTSNVNTKSTSDYDSHHFKELYEAEIPVIICTDDKGVFATSLSQEYRLCGETFNLTPSQLSTLSLNACQYVFAEDHRKILKDKVLEFIKKNSL